MAQLNLSLILFKTNSASTLLCLSPFCFHLAAKPASYLYICLSFGAVIPSLSKLQLGATTQNSRRTETFPFTDKQKAFVALSPSDNSQLQVEACIRT